MRRVATFALVGLVVGLLGCSAAVDADKSDVDPPPPTPCVPGTKIQCLCPGNVLSEQVCNVYERFEPCACENPTGAAGTGGT